MPTTDRIIKEYIPASSNINVNILYEFIESPSFHLLNNMGGDFLISAGICMLNKREFHTAEVILKLASSLGILNADFLLAINEYEQNGNITSLIKALSYGCEDAAFIIVNDHIHNNRMNDAECVLRHLINKSTTHHIRARARIAMISWHCIMGDIGTALDSFGEFKAEFPDDYRLITTAEVIAIEASYSIVDRALVLLKEIAPYSAMAAYRIAELSKDMPEQVGIYLLMAIKNGYIQQPHNTVESRIQKAPNTYASFIAANTHILHPSILRSFNRNARIYLNLKQYYETVMNNQSTAECCVCLEERIIAATNCRHPVCMDCFDAIIKNGNNHCPLCRNAV